MQELTSRERIARILDHAPVDRVGLFEHFWGDTQKRWTEEGHIKEGQDLTEHFGFDMHMCWNLSMVAKLDFEPEIIEENDEAVLTKDGNGAFLRQNKMHDGTPEHVDFTVKDRASWEEHIVPFLKYDEKRINFEGYRGAKQYADDRDLFFCWSGVNAFELMHPVCGHEHMLFGMAMDPDWVKDMAMTYAKLTIQHLETLFEREGKPDGIWFYEDMGFKERPFMSPDMYNELVKPAHKYTFDALHAMGLKIIVHSCGFIEPLLPGMIDAGMDALQVMEVKAGMDNRRVKRDFGDRIALIGGMDVRTLTANDKDAIKKDLTERMPIVMENSGYVLHSDHSIPNQVDYETYRYFVDLGLELGTYK
jgi:uroporphyrinogen decarboxylase